MPEKEDIQSLFLTQITPETRKEYQLIQKSEEWINTPFLPGMRM